MPTTRLHDSQEAMRDVRMAEGMLIESLRENEDSDRTEVLRADLVTARLYAAAALLRRSRNSGGPSYEMAELLDAQAENADRNDLGKTTRELDSAYDHEGDD